jgi:hypothetical protein
MKKLYYSDLANIPPTVCPSSLDENLEPVDPSNTAHVWDDSTDPVTCSECGTDKPTQPPKFCPFCGSQNVMVDTENCANFINVVCLAKNCDIHSEVQRSEE